MIKIAGFQAANRRKNLVQLQSTGEITFCVPLFAHQTSAQKIKTTNTFFSYFYLVFAKPNRNAHAVLHKIFAYPSFSIADATYSSTVFYVLFFVGNLFTKRVSSLLFARANFPLAQRRNIKEKPHTYRKFTETI